MDSTGEAHTLALTVTDERLNVREKLTLTFNFAWFSAIIYLIA